MKQPVVRSFLGAALVGMSVLVSFGETYYWQGDDWGLYSDPANWLIGGPDGTAATTCPGETDTLYNSQDFSFDLGGGEGKFGTWDTTNGWVDRKLFVRNGTLTATKVSTHRSYIEVYDGGLFKIADSLIASDGDASPHRVTVHAGGEMQMLCSFSLYKIVMNIEKDGKLLFNPSWFGIKGTSAQNSTIDVAGELEAPNGVKLPTTDFWRTDNYLKLTLQDGGLLRLGSGFERGADRKGLLVFEWLGGGGIAALGDVTFMNTMCSIAESASVALDVAEGKTVNLSPFTVGVGALLTKTGLGSVILGDAFANASVKITDGVLAVSDVFPTVGDLTLGANAVVALSKSGASVTLPETIQTESGAPTTLKIAANGVTINTLPSAFADVVFDLSSIVPDIPYLTCTDATSLETLRAKLAAVLPATQEVYVQGQSLVVTEKKDQTFTGGASGTITDWNDPAGWSNGQVPTEGEVAVQGEGVVLDLTDSPTVDKIEIARGAKVRVAGTAVALPTISLAGASGLEIASGSANLLKGFTSVASIVGDSVTLPTLTIASGATLNLAGGMTFKNVSIDLKGTIAKVDAAGVVSKSGVGPIFGYADAGETSYIAFTSDGGRFEVHSDQSGANGQINFVNPASGGRVKVVGDIVLKKVTIPVNGWADFGNRIFGENNPTDEPFTVVFDETTINASWWFTAAGAAHIRLINGSVIQKSSACAGHWFHNTVKDRAQIEVVGESSYFDYVGNDGAFDVYSADADVDAMVVRDGGIYLVGNAGGGGKGVFVAENGFIGVGKQWEKRDRSSLLTGFGSGRIEANSTLTVAPVDKGVGNTDWERRAKFANIPLTGAGDFVVSNGAPTKVFTVTVVNGKNTCSGAAKVVPPVVAESETAAETALIFTDGANWAGTVVANGYVGLTNLTDAAGAADVTFGRVRLSGVLPLRVWSAEKNDTITLKDGFVVEDGDAGVVELVPQEGFELKSGEEVTLGTFPASAFAKVAVKCGRRTLKVKEYPTETEGVVTVKAKASSGFRIIIR